MLTLYLEAAIPEQGDGRKKEIVGDAKQCTVMSQCPAPCFISYHKDSPTTWHMSGALTDTMD